MRNKSHQKGFTILVAVITAGILLIIAMSIGGIALKEQILSTANKESQIAYYAADTGMECAMYWNQKRGIFTDAIDENTDQPVYKQYSCNGGSEISYDQVEKSFTFKVPNIPVGKPQSGLLSPGVTTCAIVKVTKEVKSDSVVTTIESHGYNTCKPSLTRLERGISSTFKYPL